ncbi:MAG TPA: LamG-like jellyroll fold domain-containing protein, partial [Verrucomicrobiae bacterium]|nr:LamG-like jellyroll fold domain-containing protein [Verrucomicrobiae bacterium]
MKTKSLHVFALSCLIPLALTVAKGQSVYSNAVMNLNPVAYWPLQETAQPPAADIETNYGSLGPIANGYYASDANVLKGFPGAIVGDSDTAVEFTNNSQSFMIVPNTDNRVSLPAGGPLTVEAWAFSTANQQYVALVSQTGPIGAGGNNAGTNSAGWSLNQNWLPYKGTGSGNNSLYGFSFHVFNGVGSTGGAEADAVYPFLNGSWYHIVGVFDGTNCSVYVNGVNATTSQIPMTGSYVPDTWDPIEFGCNRGLGANSYHGGIDEVAIYTNALTFNQVSNHYNVAVQNISGTYFSTVLGDNPVMYWRMDAHAYSLPAPNTYPAAANYGSLASGITNFNTAGHLAVYQPGTLPGMAGPTLPGFGSFTNACAFNGLAGGVDAGYEPALDPTGNTNSFTVVGWFRDNPADNNGRWNTLAGHSDSSWRVKLNNGVAHWNYGGAASPDQVISPSTDNMNDGNWHMFACIYDTTNVTEVLDGYYTSLAASTNNIAGRSTMDAFLGASPDYSQPTNYTYNTGQQYFAGRLAHVAFFNKALTGSQIANLYTTATETTTPAPTITAQPYPYPFVRTVGGGAGSYIYEAVIAQGTPALSYQWYFNTVSNYAGATALVDDDVNYTNSRTSQVTITNLTAAQTGYYYCVVGNSFGSATSGIVYVQVQMSPDITSQTPSGSFSAYPNQISLLSVTAIGASPLTYQWYTNGVADTTAGTGPAYSATALANGTTYQCVVANGSGTTTGALDTLTVLPFPSNIAGSPYSTDILGLNPTAYWPMHDTGAQPYLGDIETNLGSLGAIGNGYYQDWNTPVVTHNVPGAIAGNSDTAIQFYNVPNDAIIVPHTSPKLTISYPYSLEAWIKPQADNAGGVGSYMVIMGQGGGGGLDNHPGRAGFALQYSGTPQSFSLVIWTNSANGNSYEQKTLAAYPPGVWYHLVCTYDGSNVIYWVNDQQAGFGTLQSGFPSQMLPDSWSPFTIGAGRWGNAGCSQPFIGSMDEVAVYTNVLTSTQIQNHYLAGTTAGSNYFQTVQNDSPILYYHMDAPPYVAPPTNGWPVLTNYGYAAVNGVYVPSTIPGSAYGPAVAGLAATNAMPGNQVSAYADAGIYPTINPVNNDSFSCTFWFKGNPADNRWNGLMSGNDGTWRCLLNPSGQVQGHGNADTASPIVNNDGLWHQFVMTFQPSNGIVLGVTPSTGMFGTNNVYVDGILVKSSLGAGTNNPASKPGPDVLLGNEYGNSDPVTGSGGRSLAGAMCEAAFFYHQVLTPAQVRSLYDAAKVPAFIASQPRSLVVNQSANFTNAMVGDGSDPLAYQWYYNSTSNYLGATMMSDNVRVTGTATATLVDNSAAISDGGYYFVIVTNNYGYATSSIVSLTVN